MNAVDFPQPKYLGEGHAFLIPSQSTAGKSHVLVGIEGQEGTAWFCSCERFADVKTCYHSTAAVRVWPEIVAGGSVSPPSDHPSVNGEREVGRPSLSPVPSEDGA